MVPRLDRITEGRCVPGKEREGARVYKRECDRKGALWALKSVGHGAPFCSERESETHGAREPAGLVSGPTLKHFLTCLSFWMNPEQANALVIRGKRSDGLETLAQTAFIKVVTFVGLYF